MTTPQTLEALLAAVERGEEFRYRFFWGHRGDGDGCFSQWYPAKFTLEGHGYTSAEQWMMASKARLFGDAAILEKILAEDDPEAVKALGRKVRGFDAQKWSAAAFELVTAGNVAKFGQDPKLRDRLLGTGEEILVEASPTDRIWGIGLARDSADAKDPRRWRGLNLLGFALVRAREVLRRP